MQCKLRLARRRQEGKRQAPKRRSLTRLSPRRAPVGRSRGRQGKTRNRYVTAWRESDAARSANHFETGRAKERVTNKENKISPETLSAASTRSVRPMAPPLPPLMILMVKYNGHMVYYTVAMVAKGRNK